MIGVLGRDVTIVQCSNPLMVGVSGTVALESMRMITIVSGTKKLSVPKMGTALQLRENGKVVIADEMNGRIEDRLSRGSKV
ncbi:MAG: ribonuclease P protein subunit [Thaumarchaeota archaeon]|nr:ribonuclease P protein subunit [Nitrososphaerota archaeon]